jgi:hypothetical protein
MEFTENNGVLSPKEDILLNIGGRDFVIPSGEIWGTKSNGNIIPVLRHRHILVLKKELGVEFEIPYPVKDWVVPSSSNNFRAYVFVYTKNGTFGDGEVYVPNSTKMEQNFALTIALKRAEDRAIMKELGLYQQGLYSEVEFMTENTPRKENPEIDVAVKRATIFQELNKICYDKGVTKDSVQSIIESKFHKTKESLSIEELTTLRDILNGK